MIDRIINFAITRRWLVMAATLCFVAVGIYAYSHLPIDAVPDITNVQVTVNSQVVGLVPEEIEKFVTFPIESELGGGTAVSVLLPPSRWYRPPAAIPSSSEAA